MLCIGNTLSTSLESAIGLRRAAGACRVCVRSPISAAIRREVDPSRALLLWSNRPTMFWRSVGGSAESLSKTGDRLFSTKCGFGNWVLACAWEGCPSSVWLVDATACDRPVLVIGISGLLKVRRGAAAGWMFRLAFAKARPVCRHSQKARSPTRTRRHAYPGCVSRHLQDALRRDRPSRWVLRDADALEAMESAQSAICLYADAAHRDPSRPVRQYVTATSRTAARIDIYQKRQRLQKL